MSAALSSVVKKSISTCVRKKLNREPRQRTRKEDEEFEQKETVLGRGGSPDPLSAEWRCESGDGANV